MLGGVTDKQVLGPRRLESNCVYSATVYNVAINPVGEKTYMVAQIPDKLLLNDQELFIVAVNGAGLFNPANYGLEPGPAYTACWRGYLCQYALCEGRLVLDDLQLSLMLPEVLGQGMFGCAGPAICAPTSSSATAIRR